LRKEIVAAENRETSDTMLPLTWRPTIILVSVRIKYLV